MENDKKEIKYMEFMERLSARLHALHSTVQTLQFSLESENVQQQAVDAVECIGFCINDTKTMLDAYLKEMQSQQM